MVGKQKSGRLKRKGQGDENFSPREKVSERERQRERVDLGRGLKRNTSFGDD